MIAPHLKSHPRAAAAAEEEEEEVVVVVVVARVSHALAMHLQGELHQR